MKKSANRAQPMTGSMPSPASFVGAFREQPVSPGLRGSFAAVWVHRLPEDSAPPIVVAPDGAIDLQWIEGRLRIAGPDKTPRAEVIAAGARVIGFRFRPAAATSWLRCPVSDLVDNRVALEDLWGSKANLLADAADPIQSVGEIIAALEAALTEYAPKAQIDAAMTTAYALVEAGPPVGASLVPWLVKSLGMSERSLRRRFDESYGYGPKTLHRILRYQRFVRLSQTSRLTTAMAAAEAGYADQPHLVRECRRLSGWTPKVLLSLRNYRGFRGDNRPNANMLGALQHF